MKKINAIVLILFLIWGIAPGQEADTASVPENIEENAPDIVNDDEQGVSINMDEVVKEEKRDTTKIKIGDRDISIVEDEDGNTSVNIKESDGENGEEPKGKKFKGHWSGLELGLNNFLDNDFSMSRTSENQFMDLNTGRSWNVNLNFQQVSLGIIGNRFGLVSGLGIEFNNYQFDGNNSIMEEAGVIVSKEFPTISLTKSKLTATYLNVPLLLELQIGGEKRSKRVYISGGIIGSLKLGSHTKVVYLEDGKKKREKDQDDYNINPLRYGLTARIGYKNLEVYSYYYPTPFFEKNKGPELYPFSVGLSVGF